MIFLNTRFYLIFLTNEIKFQILLFMCENAPDHLVGRVRQVGFFSFGAGFKLSFSSVLASLKNGKKWETERQTFDKVVLWTLPIGQCTRRTKSFKYVDCLFNLSHWNQFGFNLTFEQLEIWRLCFSSIGNTQDIWEIWKMFKSEFVNSLLIYVQGIGM